MTKVEISQVLVALREYYQEKPLTVTQMQMYVEDLECLSGEELVKAVKLYRQDPKHTRFPLPVQLKCLVVPVKDTQGDATIIADRMWTALTRYGGDSVGESRAKMFIASDAGWAVILNQGGWFSFVANNNYDNEAQATLKAQWRNAVFEMLQRAKRGEDLLPKKEALPFTENMVKLDFNKMLSMNKNEQSG